MHLEIVVRQTRNFQLDLIGKPFDVTTDFLADYINKKNLQANINICGPKYNEEKLEQLR